MDRSRLGRVALAGLAVLALGVAAATIDSAVVASGGDLGVGAPSGGGAGGDDAGVGLDLGGGGPVLALAAPCLRFLNDPRFLAAVAAVALGGGYLLARRFGSVLPSLALGTALGLPAVLLHQLLTACTRAAPRRPAGLGGGGGNLSLPLPSGGGGAVGAAAGRTVSTPSAVLGVVLVLALLGSLLLLVANTGDDEARSPGGDGDDEADVDVAAVGRAAGAAADRIEADADVGNEVYRAWVEMTRHLDVPNPQSSTPAEFAAAAVDAGMAREDVAELTDLFEAVRYGGREATADREARAVAALRRIEAAYADGPGGGGGRPRDTDDEADGGPVEPTDGTDGGDGSTDGTDGGDGSADGTDGDDGSADGESEAGGGRGDAR